MGRFNFFNQGQILIGIIVVIATVVVIVGGLYYSFQRQMPETPEIIEKPAEEEVITPSPEAPEEELPEEKEIVPEEKPPEVPEPEIPEPEIPCQNECSQTGLKRCSNNGYQTCGNYDEDNCLEWSSIINCPSNTICQNGECIQQKCADGTIYSQCSSTEPKFCQNGTLIDKCSTCGCPSDQQCQADESCITPTLSVSLSVNPSSGNAPLNDVDLTAQVSGITTGPINYAFYCNRSDSEADIVPGYNHKKDYVFGNPYTAFDVCNYSTAGTYTTKVIVERGGLAAEDRVVINVASIQCTSGPCCNLTTQTFRPSTYKCQENFNTEYRCPWGSNPGDDAGVRYQDRYCSGNSASCEGELQWSDWVVDDDCTLDEACVGGTCTALTCSDGTSYNQCSTNQPKYCDNGTLINNCSTCDCPSGQQCQADGDCVVPLPLYAVRPVIFLADDTNIDVDPYQAQVDSSFAVIRDWYKEQLGGKTFNLLPVLVYRSPLSESQLYAQYGTGTGIWYEGLKQATAANGVDVCDDHRFYYFVTPIDDIAGGFVGAENLGCIYILPGTGSIPDHMGRLIGGIIDPDWPEWWADEIREAQGGVAHEIGHGLGGSCVGDNDVNGECNGLPHNTPESGSIMFAWWNFGTTGIFTGEEKTQILQSPFIF